jgi:acyl-CoA dehydrogenase
MGHALAEDPRDPKVAYSHPHVRYRDVRVPVGNLLGPRGKGFEVAQVRLGGGRIHHAMRAVGIARRALDMACERALSRQSKGSALADKQLVQAAIAESFAEIEQFRLYVIRTAWAIDTGRLTRDELRRDIAICKNLSAKVVHNVVERAIHLHGALGVSNEMPLGRMWMSVPSFGIWDGPTEVHSITAARMILRSYSPAPGRWPTEWLPPKLEAAREMYADALAAQVAEESQ